MSLTYLSWNFAQACPSALRAPLHWHFPQGLQVSAEMALPREAFPELPQPHMPVFMQLTPQNGTTQLSILDESWTIKKAKHRRIDAFELWCWRRLLRVPWTVRRSNQSILKEISPEYSLEGLMLRPKLQYFGHLLRRDQLTGIYPDPGKD